MKIMLVLGAVAFGGAERNMVALAGALSEAHEVTLVSAARREPVYPIDARVRFVNGLGAPGRLHKLRAPLALRRLAREIRPDVAVAFLTQVNVLLRAALLGTGIPAVLCERGNPRRATLGRGLRIARALLYPGAAGFVFQTDWARDCFGPRIAGKSAVIANAVYVPEAMQGLPQAQRNRRVLAVGSMKAEKNYPLLLRAWARVAAEFPDWGLDIYGEGPLLREMQAQARALGLGVCVLFHGASDQIYAIMRQSAVYVLSSDSEGMPNTLMEAMALGMCCISTDCPSGGPRYLMREGVDGLLVPVGDEAALAAAMRRAMGEEALRQALGGAATALRERLSPARIVAQWESYLRTVAGGKDR